MGHLRPSQLVLPSGRLPLRPEPTSGRAGVYDMQWCGHGAVSRGYHCIEFVKLADWQHLKSLGYGERSYVFEKARGASENIFTG
jgi:hypothetical protein